MGCAEDDRLQHEGRSHHRSSAAATATGECIHEAFGRFRDDVQRRGGVGEANVTKTRRSAHFEGAFGL